MTDLTKDQIEKIRANSKFVGADIIETLCEMALKWDAMKPRTFDAQDRATWPFKDGKGVGTFFVKRKAYKDGDGTGHWFVTNWYLPGRFGFDDVTAYMPIPDTAGFTQKRGEL